LLSHTVLLGRGLGALGGGEEEFPIGLLAELVAEDPKAARGVVEAGRDVLGGELVDEVGAQSFVLAVSWVVRAEKGAGESCYLFRYAVRHIATISCVTTPRQPPPSGLTPCSRRSTAARP